MQRFDQFTFKWLMVRSIFGTNLFVSQAFASPFQVVSLADRSASQTYEGSPSKALPRLRYSYKKPEHSGNKTGPRLSYPHKKIVENESKTYSLPKSFHGKSSSGYGTHGYYGHGPGCHEKDPFHHVLAIEEALVAGPAIRNTKTAPADTPLAIRTTAIGIDAVAQT